MNIALTVWRGDTLLGRLTQRRNALRFEYDHGALRQFDLGVPLVSMSLPSRVRQYGDGAARPFFDGLLPEGDARRIIAYDFGVADHDTFGLLALLGRECAGALRIAADGEARVEATHRDVEPLHQVELDRLVANLRYHPLGVSATVRVSLAGVQDKLVLHRTEADSWVLPTDALPSTHILKPAVGGLDGVVENEAMCLRFAQSLGVGAATATIDEIGNRRVLIVERYDRRRTTDGAVERLHQETACQALAVPVGAIARKYEEAGGPSLAAIARLLDRWSTPAAVEELIRHVAVNAMVGNADAHAMNTSFLIADDGAVSLAPMYDVFSTVAYAHLSTTPGMFVDGVNDIRAVTAARVADEATSWGVGRTRAVEIVDDLAQRASAALDEASETVAAPANVVRTVAERISRFRDR